MTSACQPLIALHPPRVSFFERGDDVAWIEVGPQGRTLRTFPAAMLRGVRQPQLERLQYSIGADDENENNRRCDVGSGEKMSPTKKSRLGGLRSAPDVGRWSRFGAEAVARRGRVDHAQLRAQHRVEAAETARLHVRGREDEGPDASAAQEHRGDGGTGQTRIALLTRTC
jgi:hypothetical protein